MVPSLFFLLCQWCSSCRYRVSLVRDVYYCCCSALGTRHARTIVPWRTRFCEAARSSPNERRWADPFRSQSSLPSRPTGFTVVERDLLDNRGIHSPFLLFFFYFPPRLISLLLPISLHLVLFFSRNTRVSTWQPALAVRSSYSTFLPMLFRLILSFFFLLQFACLPFVCLVSGLCGGAQSRPPHFSSFDFVSFLAQQPALPPVSSP